MNRAHNAAFSIQNDGPINNKVNFTKIKIFKCLKLIISLDQTVNKYFTFQMLRYSWNEEHNSYDKLRYSLAHLK